MAIVAADPGIAQILLMRGYQFLGMDLVVALFTTHFPVHFVGEMHVPD
jgi:hypothetical protein